jgi:hypothetical protein
MSHSHSKPHNPKRHAARIFYRWHRRIGVSAALFLIWIVISGWLLNHTDSLGLAQHQIRSTLLANWYGLKIDAPKEIFTNGDHWLTSNDENFIFDNRVFNSKMHPVGITQSPTVIAVASENFLMLFSQEGTLVDTLNTVDLPFPHISKIGAGCGGIAIQDHTEILASVDGIEWQPCTENIVWSAPQPINQSQLDKITPLLIPTLSVEKLVVDLHTGRFFGRFGPYVVDFIGGCLLLLALSGLWLFFRISNSNHHRKAQRKKMQKPE